MIVGRSGGKGDRGVPCDTATTATAAFVASALAGTLPIFISILEVYGKYLLGHLETLVVWFSAG